MALTGGVGVRPETPKNGFRNRQGKYRHSVERHGLHRPCLQTIQIDPKGFALSAHVPPSNGIAND